MNYTESLAERLRHVLSGRKGIEEKKMFGGIGFLLDGNMLVAAWKEFLIARLGPEGAKAALKEDDTKPMDITGKVMKGWVMVLPEGVERDSDLREWVKRAAEFVATLPPK